AELRDIGCEVERGRVSRERCFVRVLTADEARTHQRVEQGDLDQLELRSRATTQIAHAVERTDARRSLPVVSRTIRLLLLLLILPVRKDVHGDDRSRTALAHDAEGEVVHEATIDQHAPVGTDGREEAWNRAARTDGVPH